MLLLKSDNLFSKILLFPVGKPAGQLQLLHLPAQLLPRLLRLSLLNL